MRLPSKVTDPRSGDRSPEMVRSVVVLPAPLVPIRQTTWPDSTEKLIPLTARILPYATTRSRTSSNAVTACPPRPR